MCGIVGVVDGALQYDYAKWIHTAADCMAHRGPDSTGYWWNNAGVRLGHRRLAVIDCTPSGAQPMRVSQSGPVLVFNGEIYNYSELREELQDHGCVFTSRSDSEVLLRGFERWGDGVIERLTGMFAFAIWNPADSTLLLARDRAGEKPLYYAHQGTRFAFASEIAALRSLPWVSAEIDPDAVEGYLQHQSISAPRSIYRDVQKLPAGAAAKFDGSDLTVWKYWNPLTYLSLPRLELSFEDALEQLDELILSSVRGQMIADVPIGSFLSGGIDSSVVTEAMVRVSGARVRTFTIGFADPRYDESADAQEIARFLGTSHTSEQLSEADLLRIVPRLPSMFGEPFADSSALPTHLVSAVARKYVTVSLSGDGGDESWGGYTRYDWLRHLRTVVACLGPLTSVGSNLLSVAPGKVGRGAALLRRDTAVLYDRLTSVFLPEEVQRLTGATPRSDEWRPPSDLPLSAGRLAMVTDLQRYLPDTVLTKVDRAAMAVSLETRAPLLDHRLLEFALRLPEAFVTHKRLLKALAYSRIPRHLLDRPKKGFSVPMSRWLRGPLRATLRERLFGSDLRASGITNDKYVSELWSRFDSGDNALSHKLWVLFSLSAWFSSRDSAGGTGL